MRTCKQFKQQTKSYNNKPQKEKNNQKAIPINHKQPKQPS